MDCQIRIEDICYPGAPYPTYFDKDVTPGREIYVAIPRYVDDLPGINL